MCEYPICGLIEPRLCFSAPTFGPLGRFKTTTVSLHGGQTRVIPLGQPINDPCLFLKLPLVQNPPKRHVGEIFSFSFFLSRDHPEIESYEILLQRCCLDGQSTKRDCKHECPIFGAHECALLSHNGILFLFTRSENDHV